MKSPLIHQARNYLTSVFLTTEYQYLLFIDSDVEFEPESVMRMLVAKKEIKKDRSKETWIEGYNKYKENRCPHN